MSDLILPARSRAQRAELLGQLRDLYLAEGFLCFGLDELAARLGCSRTTLSVVGPRKEQIIDTVVRSYFRRAAESIERSVTAEPDPGARVGVYLRSVAQQLAPASDAFYADLAICEPANAIYLEHTHRAAQRVQDLVVAGVAEAALRPVDARFVGAALSHVLAAIQSGAIEAATGMIDADAYRALADLVDNGLGATPALSSTSTQEHADDRHQHVSLVPAPEQQRARAVRRNGGVPARGGLPGGGAL
jgi:AcrR family transcriptional regulator